MFTTAIFNTEKLETKNVPKLLYIYTNTLKHIYFKKDIYMY